MHLTGRTLAMAVAACLASGLAFGVITTVTGPPTIAKPTEPGPTSTPPATAYSEADLGDAAITYPLTDAATMTPTPPAAVGTATEQSPEPGPSRVDVPVTPTRSTIPSPAQTPATAPSPLPSPSPSPRTATDVKPSAPPRPPSTVRPQGPARARDSRPRASTPTERASRPGPTRAAAPRPPARRATAVLGGWRPGALVVGDNLLESPRLSSGARARVVVACMPSTACTLRGVLLRIEPSAQSVTVTWSAPVTRTHRAWAASTRLG